MFICRIFAILHVLAHMNINMRAWQLVGWDLHIYIHKCTCMYI